MDSPIKTAIRYNVRKAQVIETDNQLICKVDNVADAMVLRRLAGVYCLKSEKKVEGTMHIVTINLLSA